jgi:uncharacterized protein (DUF433 family)
VLRWIRGGLAESEHQGRLPTYTFHDLISLLVVGWLRINGVKLSAIREAEAHLRRELRTPRPFAWEDIFTDGVDVLYRANPTVIDQLTAANRGGQEVMRRALGETLRGVRYENHFAAWWDIHPLVRLHPAIQFGAPCVADTRVLTSHLAELVRHGAAPEYLADAFELPLRAVAAALAFEEDLARAA